MTSRQGAPDFDVLVVGGGMVGLSLACALKNAPLRVGVVEAVAHNRPAQPDFDDRTLALAFASRRIFEAIGVWDAIEARGICPIRSIHISDRGRFGMTRLDSRQIGVDALGYVVENRALGAALQQALAAVSNATLIAPATLTAVRLKPDRALATIRHEGGERELPARLIVGADGARSLVRALAGIESRAVDYGQTAVVTNIVTSIPHAHVAYERFTSTGPIAFLPMEGGRCAVVWSVTPTEAERLLGLSDDAFRTELQAAFGDRLGTLGRVGKRVKYPLGLTRVSEYVRPRLALIGNAAHTLHPVAGQGFNLGLRDVATLAELLSGAAVANADIGDSALLQRYAAWRRRDTLATTAFTDGLVRVFSNNLLPLSAARNLGLLAVDVLPMIKRGLLKRTMGLAGRLPRLARGLPL